MSRFSILSSAVRRHYLSLGPVCVKDENIWDEMISKILVKEGIAVITSEHRKVMAAVRTSYLERERAPSVKEICELTGLTLSAFFNLYTDWAHTIFVIDGIVSTVLGIPFGSFECC
ncbi:DsrC-like domain protein [Acididesulfobacillus acetoxydans]|uniref:DsrC-like domain protein n=1 Tax=Acididesulfobacillus acetoxydans TaxID=1561005 RepID=A0A8S0XDA4_9FIRM|nr:TusE/DsrC/DsvC family sulfur relay protein [Acididesulfobacillus acetoxydans]CAA7603306.1 DsrC-like domain protein [Acididesulfobacillus acetoxydans]